MHRCLENFRARASLPFSTGLKKNAAGEQQGIAWNMVMGGKLRRLPGGAAEVGDAKGPSSTFQA